MDIGRSLPGVSGAAAGTGAASAESLNRGGISDTSRAGHGESPYEGEDGWTATTYVRTDMSDPWNL